MTPTEVLKKIIESAGSCNDTAPKYCDICPIGRMKTKEDGSYVNCIEAVGAEKVSSISLKQADAMYLKVAVELLLNMEVQKMLENEDDK